MSLLNIEEVFIRKLVAAHAPDQDISGLDINDVRIDVTASDSTTGDVNVTVFTEEGSSVYINAVGQHVERVELVSLFPTTLKQTYSPLSFLFQTAETWCGRGGINILKVAGLTGDIVADVNLIRDKLSVLTGYSWDKQESITYSDPLDTQTLKSVSITMLTTDDKSSVTSVVLSADYFTFGYKVTFGNITVRDVNLYMVNELPATVEVTGGALGSIIERNT